MAAGTLTQILLSETNATLATAVSAINTDLTNLSALAGTTKIILSSGVSIGSSSQSAAYVYTPWMMVQYLSAS